MVIGHQDSAGSADTTSERKTVDEDFTLTQEPRIHGERARSAGREAAALKLFWSWQAETPAKIGRHFIRDALHTAVDELQFTADIADADRQRLQLDPDGERLPGDPELIRSILRQIEACALFVADVTVVSRGSPGIDGIGSAAGGTLIHSDVAIELGYALHALGESRLLLVFNAHYGRLDQSPFDVRNRGGALGFTLAPTASRQDIAAEKTRFIAQLVGALDACLQQVHGGAQPASGTPSTFSKAAYFKSGETLATVGGPQQTQVHYAFQTDRLCYLRLTPVPKLERALPLTVLDQAVHEAPLLGRRRARAISASNAYGPVRFEPQIHPDLAPGTLAASTQLFASGEFWSIGAEMIVHERGEHPSWIKLPYLSSILLERVYYQHLRSLVAFARQHLALSPPWQVECGLAGVHGVYLGISAEDIRGPIQKPDVTLQRSLRSDDPAAMDRILLEFFGSVHTAAGRARPPQLHGFPPNSPR